MGQNWRRITETVKQKWGMSMKKDFKPTSNARNEAMFKEATRFAGHLRVVDRDLSKMHKEIEATFKNLSAVMVSALPRVFEENDGVAVPAEATTMAIGADVQVDRLTSAAAELKGRLEAEVLQPIRQWMVAYRTIQERMERLESLRLETDSRRRTVSALAEDYERKKVLLGRTPTHKAETDAEMTLRKMQHKEDKLQRTGGAFQEMEQTVYNSLYTLIKDTSVLRDYCAAAVLIMQEAYVQAYSAFDGSVAPLALPSSGGLGADGAPGYEGEYEGAQQAQQQAQQQQGAPQRQPSSQQLAGGGSSGAQLGYEGSKGAYHLQKGGSGYPPAGGAPVDAHRKDYDQSYESAAAAALPPAAGGAYGGSETPGGGKPFGGAAWGATPVAAGY